MDPAIVAIIAALVGPVGAYLVAARRFSGKIESSDAAALWKESSSIREWSADRIAELNAEISHLRGRIESCETSNTGLRDENRKLAGEIRTLNDTIAELRDEVHNLTSQLRESRGRVRELEGPDAGS